MIRSMKDKERNMVKCFRIILKMTSSIKDRERNMFNSFGII